MIKEVNLSGIYLAPFAAYLFCALLIYVPLRIWLDPADRICIAHGGNRITVLFPLGRIPPAIAEKMRPEDFPPDDDEPAGN